MPVAAVHESGEMQPRIITIREFDSVKAGLALLGAGHAVIFVFRTNDADRERVLDLLTGWSFGSNGSLDRIGPNTLIARPQSAAPVQLARAHLVVAVQEAFAATAGQPLTRADEDRLRPLAAAGSSEARRRLIDAYTELATLIALWLRPAHVPAATAVTAAQQELDALIAWRPTTKPLLVELVDRVHSQLHP